MRYKCVYWSNHSLTQLKRCSRRRVVDTVVRLGRYTWHRRRRLVCDCWFRVFGKIINCPESNQEEIVALRQDRIWSKPRDLQVYPSTLKFHPNVDGIQFWNLCWFYPKRRKKPHLLVSISLDVYCMGLFGTHLLHKHVGRSAASKASWVGGLRAPQVLKLTIRWCSWREQGRRRGNRGKGLAALSRHRNLQSSLEAD